MTLHIEFLDTASADFSTPDYEWFIEPNWIMVLEPGNVIYYPISTIEYFTVKDD